MVTNLFKRLIMQGGIDTSSAVVRIAILNGKMELSVDSTSASPIIDAGLLVTDPSIPTGGIEASFTPSDTGLIVKPSVDIVKLDGAKYAGTIVVYVEGTFNNTTNPIVFYTNVEYDRYYNIVLSDSQVLTI